MESLLILLAIVGLQVGAAWFKKRMGQRREPPSSETFESDADDDGERTSDDASESLQDLIRKFREEQAKTLDSPEEFSEEPLPEGEEPLPEWNPPVREEPLDEPAKPFARAETDKKAADEKIFQDRFPAESESPCLPFPEKNALGREVSAKPCGEREIGAVEKGGTLADVPSRANRPDFAFSRENARKGFLWACVLENPRFKRRTPAFNCRSWESTSSK